MTGLLAQVAGVEPRGRGGAKRRQEIWARKVPDTLGRVSARRWRPAPCSIGSHRRGVPAAEDLATCFSNAGPGRPGVPAVRGAKRTGRSGCWRTCQAVRFPLALHGVSRSFCVAYAAGRWRLLRSFRERESSKGRFSVAIGRDSTLSEQAPVALDASSLNSVSWKACSTRELQRWEEQVGHVFDDGRLFAFRVRRFRSFLR